VATTHTLAAARDDRWLPDPPLRTIEDATAHLDRLGFAVLFPADRITAPSLWEAIAGPDEVPFASGMGPAEELVWTWKDDLPSRRGMVRQVRPPARVAAVARHTRGAVPG
jgi:hypothetical protein